MPAMAQMKERYELKFMQNVSDIHDSYVIHIQDGKIIKDEDIKREQPFCDLNLGYKESVSQVDAPFLMDSPLIYPRNENSYIHNFHNFDWGKVRSLECTLSTEEKNINEVNDVLKGLATLSISSQILPEDLEDKKLRSACEHKVLDYYSGLYHRTFKAASNTFLNNFIGRKNTFAHAFGAPRIAFLQLSFTTNNYIADRIVEKSKKTKEEVYYKYLTLLRTGDLCRDLQKDYKKPRKVRAYLLKRLQDS